MTTYTATEICKARTGTPANHCWHDTDVALMSYPAKTEQVCCFCGQVRHLQMQWNRTIGNHGAHMPPNARNEPRP